MHIGRQAQGRAVRLTKLRETFVDPLGERLKVNRVSVIIAHDSHLDGMAVRKFACHSFRLLPVVTTEY